MKIKWIKIYYSFTTTKSSTFGTKNEELVLLGLANPQDNTCIYKLSKFLKMNSLYFLIFIIIHGLNRKKIPQERRIIYRSVSFMKQSNITCDKQ